MNAHDTGPLPDWPADRFPEPRRYRPAPRDGLSTVALWVAIITGTLASGIMTGFIGVSVSMYFAV